LIDRYLSGLLDPFVTLLEVHKLMYLMQEGGEPLRLRFVEAPYGPYAENLRHVLKAVEGYYISGFGEGGEEPGRSLELVPGATSDAARSLEREDKTRARLERVARLVQGFESPFGLELLTTVHWVATRERPTSDHELIARIYSWGEHKRQFSEKQIRLAKRVLVNDAWIPAEMP
jgi:hypothetical protein